MTTEMTSLSQTQHKKEELEGSGVAKLLAEEAGSVSWPGKL